MGTFLMLSVWGIFVTWGMWRRGAMKVLVLAGIGVTFVGMALCFSRGAYLGFCVVWLALGLLRWRKLLVAGPVFAAIVLVAMPGVKDRLLSGFDENPMGGRDWNTITAGRTGELWPPVIKQIRKSPVLGHGRLGIWRTEAYREISERLESPVVPSTPHNAYLEILLDGGLVGLGVVLTVFVGSAVLGGRLVRALPHDPLFTALGAMVFVHVIGCMASAVSGGHFFPRQSSLCTYALFLMMVRVWYGWRAPAWPVQPAVAPPPEARAAETYVGGYSP